MGTLDFYDTESGPIGIMQMDIDDSIEEMVFFVPNSKGKQTQTQTLSKLGSPSAGNTTKLRGLENTLYEKTAVRNKEYGDMSVKNLGKLDQEISKLKAEIIALKG